VEAVVDSELAERLSALAVGIGETDRFELLTNGGESRR